MLKCFPYLIADNVSDIFQNSPSVKQLEAVAAVYLFLAQTTIQTMA